MSSSDNVVKPSVFDEIKVYVLHRDVPHEFGEAMGVFSTREKAEAALEKACKAQPVHGLWPRYHRGDLSIEEFTLDEYLHG